MLDSIYHGALKIFKNGVFSVKRLRFSHVAQRCYKRHNITFIIALNVMLPANNIHV